jgi:Zn ribbon nucleic-acid-binding protein
MCQFQDKCALDKRNSIDVRETVKLHENVVNIDNT